MPELPGSEPPNRSVRFSADDARELSRLVRLLLHALPSADTPRAVLIDRARTVFNERRRRSDFLPRNLFDEPGWDILLALYLTDFAGGRQTVGRLISWIGTPTTTALRWLNYLEDHHLISREQHPRDRRVVFVDLSSDGRNILDAYFLTLEAAGTATIQEPATSNRDDVKTG